MLRNRQLTIPPSVGRNHKEHKISNVTMNKDWWKRNYQNRLLILGIILTAFGIYELQDSFVIKSRLIEIKGTIRNADTYSRTNTDRYGHSSQRSELIFYLNEHKKKFYLARNIGDKYYDNEYEEIANRLKQADSISVWIKPSELNEFQPKVFQIASDKNTILDFNNVRTEKNGMTIFLLILGIGSMLLYLYLRFPEKWNKIMK